MENRSVVPIRCQSIFQKTLVNRTSRSETILRGTPWRRTSSLKNRRAVWAASAVFEQAMKCAILLNRSTMTRMESSCRRVLGSPKTKSRLTSCQGESGTGRGRYGPAVCLVSLPIVHMEHLPIIRRMSRRKRGQ